MKNKMLLFLFLAIFSFAMVKCECNLDFDYVTCTNMSYNRQTDEILKNSFSIIRYTFKIINSKVPQVFPEMFEKYDKVQVLHLINDNVSSILPLSFIGMPKLKKLFLNNNSYSHIEPDTFTGLPNLTILDLSYNKLHSLQNLLIPSLEELYVTNNYLIDLNKNSLKGLDKLKILNLHHNNITSLEYINQAHSLEVLNISDNYIQSTTEYDFHNMKSLKTLDLSENIISRIHPKLFINSHNLTKLLLINNNIENFSSDVFYKSIQYLDLSSNYLAHIDCEQIHGTVILSKNFLIKIYNFGGNTTSIDLRDNDFTAIDKDYFSHLNKLETLTFSNNLIKNVNVDAFKDLKALSTLSLDRNQISKLHVGTFQHFDNLTTLNISWNNIEVLEHGIFTKLNQLIVLDLSYNKLHNLNILIFSPLKLLENLYLYGNPNPINHIHNGYSNPVRELRKQMPDLRVLSIQFEDIGCEQLADNFLDDYYRFELKQGEEFHTHNVHGIACNPDTKYLPNHVSSILQFIGTIRAIFILMTIAFVIITSMQFISMYHKYFKNNKSKPFKRNGESCTVNLLTEDNHD